VKKIYIDGLLLLFLIIGFLLYSFTSVPREHMFDLVSSLDLVIPFIPIFVIPYISFHILLIPATFVLLYRQHDVYHLRVFLVSAILLLFVSNFIFFVFPTYCSIRPIIEDSSFLHRLVQLVYDLDHPCALCPSVHVNISTLCAFMWLRVSSRGSRFMVFWAFLVVLSTLFIRQHYVVDVIAGLFSAWLFNEIGQILVKRFYKGEGIWKRKIVA
jgi:membrane-associated phospholipid phosphatase